MSEENTAVIEDDPIEVRKAKRQALIDAGQNPYGHAFAYTHHAADLEPLYAELPDGESTEDSVAVAGRIMAKRVQGKVSFFTLRDSSGEIQRFCRIRSVSRADLAEEGAPFGRECREMLEFAPLRG